MSCPLKFSVADLLNWLVLDNTPVQRKHIVEWLIKMKGHNGQSVFKLTKLMLTGGLKLEAPKVLFIASDNCWFLHARTSDQVARLVCFKVFVFLCFKMQKQLSCENRSLIDQELDQ